MEIKSKSKSVYRFLEERGAYYCDKELWIGMPSKNENEIKIERQRERKTKTFKRSIWKSGTTRTDIVVDENHKRFTSAEKARESGRDKETIETNKIKLWAFFWSDSFLLFIRDDDQKRRRSKRFSFFISRRSDGKPLIDS